MLMRLFNAFVAFIAAAALAFLFHLVMRDRRAAEERPSGMASYLPPEPESYGAFRARSIAESSADASAKRASGPSGPGSRSRIA